MKHTFIIVLGLLCLSVFVESGKRRRGKRGNRQHTMAERKKIGRRAKKLAVLGAYYRSLANEQKRRNRKNSLIIDLIRSEFNIYREAFGTVQYMFEEQERKNKKIIAQLMSRIQKLENVNPETAIVLYDPTQGRRNDDNDAFSRWLSSRA